MPHTPLIDAMPHTPLIDAAELAQLRSCILSRRDRSRRRVNTPWQGQRPSAFKGHGMELHDLRPYRHGDDTRHIDWRTTARRGRPFSRLFVEERNRHLCIALDRSVAMQFGTQDDIRMTTAARCAALLAFSALNGREQVSGLVIDDGIHYFPPARTSMQLYPLLQAMTAAPRPDAQTMSPESLSLDDLAERAMDTLHANTALCLISGFDDCENNTTDSISGNGLLPDRLVQLAGYLELRLIRIRDHAQDRLPDAGPVRLHEPGSDHSYVINTRDPQLRARFEQQSREYNQQFAHACLRQGIEQLTVYNGDDVFTRLDDWL